MILQNGDIVLVNGISGIYYNGQITLSNLTITDQEPDYVLRFDGQETYEPELPGIPMPELSAGDRGMYVAILQICLKYHGYRLEPDGSFGAVTNTALRDFRKNHYLTGDTVADSETWKLLLEE